MFNRKRRLHRPGTAAALLMPGALLTAMAVVTVSVVATRAEPSPAASPSAAKADPGDRNADGGIVASKEQGWPQWRGPRRDGICDEKGLLQSWPAGGPKLLWKVGNLGRGYSSPIIARDTLYITGDVGDDLVVFAFDLEGKPVWQAKNGLAWKRSYPGSRASCLFDAGLLYNMNAHGRVACFDAATGQEVWTVDILERFDGRVITWGLSECLLADGPRLIVTPGGKKALMAALDKNTGDTVWTADGPPGERAGYSSPILFEFRGRRHIVNFSSRHAFGVDADTGRLLWTVPYQNRYEVNVSPPVYADGHVFLVAPDGPDGTMLRLRVDGPAMTVETAWTDTIDTLSGGAVLVDGLIYCAGYRKLRGWRCLDWRTGQTKFESRDVDSGSALWADGRLYLLAETGTMALVKPGPQGFEVTGRFDFQTGRSDVWAHPVIHRGRMYLRYHDTLCCYDIKQR